MFSPTAADSNAPAAAAAADVGVPTALVWLGVVALVYLLLIGVATIGDGFTMRLE